MRIDWKRLKCAEQRAISLPTMSSHHSGESSRRTCGPLPASAACSRPLWLSNHPFTSPLEPKVRGGTSHVCSVNSMHGCSSALGCRTMICASLHRATKEAHLPAFTSFKFISMVKKGVRALSRGVRGRCGCRCMPTAASLMLCRGRGPAEEGRPGEHQFTPGSGDEVRQVHAGVQDVHQVPAFRQGCAHLP